MYQKLTLSALIIGAILVLSFPPPVKAQTAFFNERDNQYLLLGLKRAKTTYETQKAEYARQQGLFADELISKTELDRAMVQFTEAEVNYQQQMLSVLFEAQYVTVQSAVKYQESSTTKRVKLVIANAAAGGGEFKQLIEFEDELWKSLQPEIVHDVYVSLLDDSDAIIALPYEAKVDELRYGEPVELDFQLLVDADTVSVNIIYGNGSSRRLKVFLQKDASENRAVITSKQFSQEVELGGTSDYNLFIELFSSETDAFKLEAFNLPSELNRYFIDSESGSRVSQFQFTEGVIKKQIALRVYLPEKPTDQVRMDESIPFYAVAMPRQLADELGDMQDRKVTLAELQEMGIGYATLELVPRGVGEILVRAPQLFHTIQAGETVDVTVEVVNDGTRRLDNIEVEVEPPFNWDERVEPTAVSNLAINEEAKVQLYITPPVDVTPGRYEVRVRTTSLSDDMEIRGEDKTITVQITQEANIFGTLFIVLLIIGLVVGIVVFGIRLSRR